MPTREEVAAAWEAAEVAEKTRDEARVGHDAIARKLAVAQQQEKTLADTLGDAAAAPVKKLEAVASERAMALRAAEAAVEGLAGIESGLDTLEAEQRRRGEEVKVVEAAVTKLQQELAAARQAVHEREREVPEQWCEPQAVDKVVKEARLTLDRSCKALAEARTGHRGSGCQGGKRCSGTQGGRTRLEG